MRHVIEGLVALSVLVWGLCWWIDTGTKLSRDEKEKYHGLAQATTRRLYNQCTCDGTGQRMCPWCSAGNEPVRG
jgi:hypothetical protein